MGMLNCNHFRKTQSGENSSSIWEGTSAYQLLRELAPQISPQVLALPPVIVDTFLTAPLERGLSDMDRPKILHPRATGKAAFREPPHRKGRGEGPLPSQGGYYVPLLVKPRPPEAARGFPSPFPIFLEPSG